MRNVWQTEEFIWKSCEWKGQHKDYYILQMHTDRIWRHLCFWIPFSWISTECVEQVKNAETKSWKVSLRKAGSLMSGTSLCLVPNTRCHFARKKKTKKTQLQNINIWKPGRFLRTSDLTSISYRECVRSIAKCLQENLSTSDLQPVSNKQMSNSYGGIGFCKEKAKTFAQLLLHWDHGMNIGRPMKIPFFWRHKFPLGCDGHVSKFPIQSLYYPWLLRHLNWPISALKLVSITQLVD